MSMYHTWKLYIVSASIDKSKKSSWDIWPDNGDPDVYIEVKLGGTTKNTTTKNNSWTPYWNENVGSATATTFINSGFTLTIKEDDALWDETIGTCGLTATASVIKSGSGYISSCTDSSGKNYIKEVKFKFLP